MKLKVFLIILCFSYLQNANCSELKEDVDKINSLNNEIQSLERRENELQEQFLALIRRAQIGWARRAKMKKEERKTKGAAEISREMSEHDKIFEEFNKIGKVLANKRNQLKEIMERSGSLI